MSLLVDPDYAIHALRLAYLRKIDDHTGPRVITLPSISNLSPREVTNSTVDPSSSFNASSSISDSFADGVSERHQRSSSPSVAGVAISSSSVLTPLPANSHVVIAGLNDARFQPELATLYSPKLNDVFASRQDTRTDLFGGPSDGSKRGLPSAWNSDTAARGGLKYTTTIFGPGRSGALGMRVSGRRATSGDTPRRRGLANDDDAVREDSEEQMVVEGEGDEKSTANDQSGSVFHPSSTHGGKVDWKSKRSSSLRIPANEPRSTPATEGYRSRSSSQPQQVAVSDDLHSYDGTYDDESVFSDESQPPSRSVSDHYPDAKNNPGLPPRPPRRVYRAQSIETAPQRDTANDDGFQLSPKMMTDGVQTSIPLRRRSASEGAADLVRDTANQRDSTGSAVTEKGQAEMEEKEGEEATRMNRLNSNSTIFSLASPPMNRRRNLSDRWQRGGQADDQSIANISPTSNRISSQPAESAAANLRSRSDDPSPFLRKAMLSASMEASDRLERDGLQQSSSSSAPLDTSVDSTSSPSREQDPTHASISPSDGNDESLDESAAASSTNFAAPLSSALGLQTGWNDKGGGIGETEEEERRVQAQAAQAKGRHSPGGEKPRERSPAGLEPQQKQQWFSSLRADAQTVARRFEGRPQRSGISALLSKHSEGPSNTFASQYKGVAGSSVSGGANTIIEVYFPFARQNQGSGGRMVGPKSGAEAVHVERRSMSLNVRKAATMEEVIGYSLYCYVEEGWQPRLDESLPYGASEAEREVRLSTLGWTLRIVEDGEVDDDYPAIDRSLTVGKFGADELAVCEATAGQVKQHQSVPHSTRRRTSQPKQQVQQSQHAAGQPSMAATLHPNADTSASSALYANTPVGPSARLAATAGNIPAGSLVNFGGTPIFASSALSRSVLNPSSTSIFLRVLITPNSEVKYKTTLQVPSDMYLADVLETICRKRQLANVDQWALVVPEMDVVVPLDRTVESLQGNHDLALVKRQDLGDQAGAGALTGQSTNPNASIFKRFSEPVQVSGYKAAKELASTYKSYTVNRKQASFLGRHERILTIDGDWLHIIPTDTRAFQTQSGTSSFPITAIISCTQSRLPSSFKLIVARENDQKRYEFEAESSRVAAEIVEEINSLMKRTK